MAELDASTSGTGIASRPEHMPTGWRRTLRATLDTIDGSVARFSGRRKVLLYVRSAMHAAVLEPVASALRADPRIDLRYLSERRELEAPIAAACEWRIRWIVPGRATWQRVDLLIGSDPWSVPTLRRCRRRINFFHGVAGKYDLEDPSHLPIGFDLYDRVAFVNADRMQRYIARGIIPPDKAVLVGFPKLDPLVNGHIDGDAVRKRLGLASGRPTALFAPTWSPASSLNLAGEKIVAALAETGWNVIIKPHAWSFDLEPKYSGGIDWRKRLQSIERPGQVVLSDTADATPLLAAADLMVTDHSSIGFEFCLLDRPLIVFDTPDLAAVARINPERLAALRSAARVVNDASAIGTAAAEELATADRLKNERAAAARPLFHRPGTATDRALEVVYELLDLRAPVPHFVEPSAAAPETIGTGA
jgi:hypothetical protein